MGLLQWTGPNLLANLPGDSNWSDLYILEAYFNPLPVIGISEFLETIIQIHPQGTQPGLVLLETPPCDHAPPVDVFCPLGPLWCSERVDVLTIRHNILPNNSGWAVVVELQVELRERLQFWIVQWSGQVQMVVPTSRINGWLLRMLNHGW